MSCVGFVRSRGGIHCTERGRQYAAALFMSFAMLASLTGPLLETATGVAAAMANESVELVGEVIERGAPCVRFRTQAGETISLEGASPQVFQPGMRLRISGNWVQISRCMQGPAFLVTGHAELK